ncbi:MAG: AMP-dependent synthetase/ligase [Arenicellales bacterium]|nr:AMP-dependent synthetase/ligase [Arenicellales bacterium]
MPEREASVYPKDALAGRDDLDVISIEQAPTLDKLFRKRVALSGDRVAYTDYDFTQKCWRDYTWQQMATEVATYQSGMRKLGLQKGDHVALRLRNCRHWVIFDQAALGLGLVVVPLYVADRPDNINYVVDHAMVKLLLVEKLTDWRELETAEGETPNLRKVVVLESCQTEDERIVVARDWLEDSAGELSQDLTEPGDLATIVYTSGTTGRPKGVMLSHMNILANAHAGLKSVAVTPQDVLLSFLPLSHTLERTVGYYLSMMAGARIAFARSIRKLSEDLSKVRPTGLITVPRVFERSYGQLKTRVEHTSTFQKWLFEVTVETGWDRFEWRQGRGHWKISFLIWPLLDRLVARKVRLQFGGRLRVAVVGGAPLPLSVSRLFIPLGINLLHGYGLTESSPSISINTLEQNRPATIGLPLHGVLVKIGDNDELLAKGPNIMLGYWRDEAATTEALEDGWLHTGDQARIDEGFISITGRIKDILVLANGEKVPPADMEMAIEEDALFEQSMVIGEQMPYLTALVVLNQNKWKAVAQSLNVAENDELVLSTDIVEEFLLERVRRQITEFPGYAKIRRATFTLKPWTVSNDLITPTLKIKRSKIKRHYEKEIAKMYKGYETFKPVAQKTNPNP